MEKVRCQMKRQIVIKNEDLDKHVKAESFSLVCAESSVEFSDLDRRRFV